MLDQSWPKVGPKLAQSWPKDGPKMAQSWFEYAHPLSDSHLIHWFLSRVKLCDFGSVKSQGDIVIKKNELLPYCPPELVAKHANEYYQVII